MSYMTALFFKTPALAVLLRRKTYQASFILLSIGTLLGIQFPAVTIALSQDQVKAFNEGVLYYNTEVCGSGTSTASTAPVIVLDPGHSGTDTNTVDQQTGLHDHDYPNQPEMDDVFDVALDVQTKLEDAGYTVISTKGGQNPDDQDANDTVSLRQRAEVANQANAALAVSIHDDPGQQWDNFAQIYVQNVDGYRIGTKGKVTFKDAAGSNAADIAQKSQAYGKIFETERTSAEGRKASIVAPNFNGRAGIDPGNMAQVQMFSKVPWVYNEVGAAPKSQHLSKAHKDAYALGLVNAIKKAVPVGSGGTASTGNSTVSASSLTMQSVDLTQFKPDPKAESYFDKTSLPLLKRYIPLYVKAAQQEGVAQNWEILAALHGPELGYKNYFKPNGVSNSPIGAAGGPSGPYQETAYELKSYLSDPDYGPVLKTLITPAGAAIPTTSLSDDQFVVLSRLAFHRWVSQALGSDYSKLKSGPIAFDPSTTSSNFLARVMSRWNSGDPVEGFNGYNTGANAYNPGASVWPGMATTYFLLKKWEANGGMATVAGSATTGCSTGATTGSVDCQTATGIAKILCEAKKYDVVSYVWGGGHNGPSNWHKSCPSPDTSQTCGLDCSGLVSVAVYDAFGLDTSWTTDTQRSDTKNWKEIPLDQIQAGDTIQPNAGHVEIVDSVSGNTIKTFGAHTSHYPQPRQVGPSSYQKTSAMKAYRYIGKGV